MNRPDAPDDLIRELRAARPEPAVEPDWDRMVSDIAMACEQVDDERRRSILGRLRAFLAPRYLLVAAAAAALVLAWVTWRPAPAPELATPAIPQPAPEAAPPRPAQLEVLDAEELDRLAVALADWGGPAGEPLGLLRAPEPGPADSVELPAEVAAGIAGISEPAGEVEYVTGFGLGVFEEPDYGDWVEDLDESDLDALDAYLAEVLPG